MKSNLLIFSLFILVAGVVGCKKNEPSPQNNNNNSNPCSNQIMECTIGGTNWAATSFSNTLLKAVDQGIDSKRLDIRGTAADGSQLILTISDYRDGLTGDCMRIDTWFMDVDQNYCTQNGSNVMVCNGGLGTYLSASNQTQMTDLDGVGEIVITSCDDANKRVSGTFTFELNDFINGTTVTVANGVFTDVCYSVLQ